MTIDIKKDKTSKKKKKKSEYQIKAGVSLRGMSKGSVRDLPEARQQDIKDAFLNGYTYAQLIEMIQEDWGKLQKVKPATLKAQLVRFKKRHIKVQDVYEKGDTKVRLSDGTMSTHVSYRQVDDEVSPLSAMGKLVNMQNRRVRKLYLLEEKMPSLMTTLNKEINTLGTLIDKYAGLGFDMGTIYKIPERRETALVKSEAIRELNESRKVEAHKTNTAGKLLKLVGGSDI
jgi:tmRNA-binding protein